MSSTAPKASLMGLPIELRGIILEYILPTDNVKCCLVRTSQVTHYVTKAYPDFRVTDREANPYIRFLQEEGSRRLDILRVNRQCNAEGSRILYNCAEKWDFTASVCARYDCPEIDEIIEWQKEHESHVYGPYSILNTVLFIEPI